MNQLPNI